MIEPEDIVSPEWAEWYRMTPQERWAAQDQMWATYLALGGSLDAEPDPQSPFYGQDEWREFSDGGRQDIVMSWRNGKPHVSYREDVTLP